MWNVAHSRTLCHNVGLVCCWFSTLLQKVFLQVLWFSFLLKSQHVQIPIRSGISRATGLSVELLLSVTLFKQHRFISLFHSILMGSIATTGVVSQCFRRVKVLF